MEQTPDARAGRDGAIEIGEEVRAARTAIGLTTRQLSQRIGTSQPFVSNIENGRIYPSLRTLTLLADALEVPRSRLLPAAERVERVSAAAIRRRGGEPAARTVLGGADRDLEVVRVELAPGEREPRPCSHDGEELVLVLDGEVDLLREGVPALRLTTGDTAWVDGAVPHRLAAPDDLPGPALALVTIAVGRIARGGSSSSSAGRPGRHGQERGSGYLA